MLEERISVFLLLRLFPHEVIMSTDLLQCLLVHALQIYLCTCGNDVCSVHSSQRYTVDLEGPSDQERALVKVLEKDYSLAAESAGEEDEDGAWLERRAWSGRLYGFAGLTRVV